MSAADQAHIENFRAVMRAKIDHTGRPGHDGREVVTVVHDPLNFRSVIDGTDEQGRGSMWHMDDSDPDQDVALANLDHILGLLGWERDDEDWHLLLDPPKGAKHLILADFHRKDSHIVVMDGESR
jgi:hypothetical protein